MLLCVYRKGSPTTSQSPGPSQGFVMEILPRVASSSIVNMWRLEFVTKLLNLGSRRDQIGNKMFPRTKKIFLS